MLKAKAISIVGVRAGKFCVYHTQIAALFTPCAHQSILQMTHVNAHKIALPCSRCWTCQANSLHLDRADCKAVGAGHAFTCPAMQVGAPCSSSLSSIQQCELCSADSPLSRMTSLASLLLQGSTHPCSLLAQTCGLVTARVPRPVRLGRWVRGYAQGCRALHGPMLHMGPAGEGSTHVRWG